MECNSFMSFLFYNLLKECDGNQTRMAKKLDVNRDLIYQWKHKFKIGNLNALAGEVLLQYYSNNIEAFAAARQAFDMSRNIDLIRGGAQECPCYEMVVRLDEEHNNVRETANRLEGSYALSSSASRFKDVLKRIFCKRIKAETCQTCPAYDPERKRCPLLEFYDFFHAAMKKVEELNVK